MFFVYLMDSLLCIATDSAVAVGHHLGERFHTIERSHNLLSEAGLVNLDEGGSEWGSGTSVTWRRCVWD